MNDALKYRLRALTSFGPLPTEPTATRFLVTAISVDVRAFNARSIPVTGPRTSTIDTETYELFTGLRHPWDIADRYEQYWNRLNESDVQNPGQCHTPSERVVVINVAVAP